MSDPGLFPPALPYTTLLPDNVAVRVGEVIRLQCLAHGTPPLSYTWSRLDGPLPSRAVVNGGDLQINLASAEDAGSYKCVANNGVGSSEVVAKVTVRCEFSPPLPELIRLKGLLTGDPRGCSPPGGPGVTSGGGEGSRQRGGVHLLSAGGRRHHHRVAEGRRRPAPESPRQRWRPQVTQTHRRSPVAPGGR